MKPRTRQLLELISQELTVDVLEALAESPRTRSELEDATGASEAGLRRLMARLVDLAIVDEDRVRSGGRGRPSYRWRLAAADELASFIRSADDFRHSLARRQLDDLNEGD